MMQQISEGSHFQAIGRIKLRSLAESLFTYLLRLKYDDHNHSFCSSMRIRTGFNVDEITFGVIA
jgi:hypothetical protein